MDDIEIENLVKEKSSRWGYKLKPSSQESINKLTSQVKFLLPNAYIKLFSFCNGVEGPLGIRPGWFSIWEIESVIELNKGYRVEELIPGYWGFGSDGGGELFTFKIKDGEPYKIYMVPFIPMEEREAILIADDFDSFLRSMGENYQE